MEKPSLLLKEEKLQSLRQTDPTALKDIINQNAAYSFKMGGMGILIGSILTCIGTLLLYLYLAYVRLITDWMLIVLYLCVCFLSLLVISVFITFAIRKILWRSNPCYTDNGVLIQECDNSTIT